MTDITAEVVGPVDRPPVPTETPEVWMFGRWFWVEEIGSTSPHWRFIIIGNDESREQADGHANPGDILIRIPASGGGK